MKQPKYKIGDKVWLIDSNQVKEAVIMGIRLDSSDAFVYDTNGTGFAYYPFHEERIFLTKQDLINSL